MFPTSRRLAIYPVVTVLLIFVMGVSSVLAAPTDPFNGATPTYSDTAQSPEAQQAGDWGVADQRGAATYTYPINTPPGRNGMAPALALRYSSQAPLRGGIAVGWTLDIPVIERDTSVGYTTTPVYRAALNGVSGRLVEAPDDLTPGYHKAYRAEFDASYTRFFRQNAEGGNYGWLALTTDGVRHYFDYPLSAVSGLPWVITRQEDPFGNTVRYRWSPVFLNHESTTPVELQLDAIEYSENTQAELSAHARITFDYTPIDVCPNSIVPIGAASVGDGQLNGARRLKAINTEVRDDAQEWSLRKRILLAYDTGASASEVDLDADLEGTPGVEGPITCVHPNGQQSEAPLRYLTHIQEQAWDLTGKKSILPLTAFTYNRRSADHLHETPPVTINTAGFATYGDRYGATGSLLDLDSDGVQDQVRVTAENGKCVMSWQRGLLGGAFESQERQITLPTAKWRDNLASPGVGERCTLNGQVALRSRFYTPPSGEPLEGAPATGIVSYHFMDMTGDGRIDLMTNIWVADGLHHTYLPFGSAVAGLAPENGNTAAPGPVPEPPYLTPPPMVPEQDARRFVWRVYQNTGSSNVFEQHATLTVMSPPMSLVDGDGEPRLNPPSLPPSTSDESVAKGWISGMPSLIDLDGDGFKDFVDVGEDQPRLGSVDGYWSVYFGQGDGTFGPEYQWPVPLVETLGDNEPSVTQPDGRIRSAQETVAALRDLSGDGLPDLIVRARADGQLKMYRNTGDRFGASPVNLGSATPLEVLVTEHDALFPGQDFVLNGVRGYTRRMFDVDSDGLEDMVIFAIDPDGNPIEGVGGVYYNVGDALILSHWLPAYWSAAQRNLVVANGEWSLQTDLIDGDGDGISDLVQWSADGAQQTRRHSGYTTAPRTLASVRNLNGLAIDYQYSPSSDPVVVQWSQAPNTWLPGVKWVVSGLQISGGHGTPSMMQTYQYGDPAFQSAAEYTGAPEPSNFLGFRTTTQTIESQADTPGKKVVRRYAYDESGEPGGRLVAEWVYSGKANSAGFDLHQYRTLTWSRKSLFNRKLYATHLAQQITRTCTAGASDNDCMNQSENVHRHSEVWEAYPTSAMAKLYVQTTTQAGSGLTVGAADRRMVTAYEIRYGQPPFAATDYRVLPIREETLAAVDTSGAISFVLNGRTATRYDPATGLPIQTDRWQDAKTVATTLQSFDPLTGNLTGRTRPNQVAGAGLSRTYGYDAYQLHVVVTTNELGHTVYTIHDLATGAPLEQRGPNAIAQAGALQWEREQWVYDGFGRMVQHWVSADNPLSGQPHQLYVVNRNSYYDFESPQRVQVEAARDFGGATWITTERTVDGLGRLLSDRQHLENGALAVTTYGYDSVGNRATIMTPDPRVDDGSTVKYHYHFDGLGRVVAFDQPDGNGVAISHSGLEKTITDVTHDGSGGSRKEVTDVFGRMIEVHEFNPESGAAITRYAYDVNGQMTAITDADGHVTEIAYDWLGNRASMTRAGHVWRYGYDLNSNMVAEISPIPAGEDPVLHTVQRAYDALNRVVSVTYAEPATGEPAVMSLRDVRSAQTPEPATAAHFANQLFLPLVAGGSGLAVDHPAAQPVAAAASVERQLTTIEYRYDLGDNGVGRLSRITVPASALTYAIDYVHDARGQIRHETRTIQLQDGVAGLSTSQSVARSYNALGQMVQSTWDDGQSWRLGYDGRGLISAVEWFDPAVGAWQQVASYTRSHAGQVRARTSSYNQQRDYRYDILGRVQQDSIVANGVLVAERSYVLNGANDVIRVTGQTEGMRADAKFAYDAQHRLRTAVAPNGYTGAFTYSPAGNLLTAQVDWQNSPHARNVSYRYGAVDHQAVDQLIDQASGNSYAEFNYDLAGNMVNRTGPDGALQLTWDALERIRMVESANGNERYYYDQDGNRMLAVNSQSGARFWFDERESHYTLDGAPVRNYLHLADSSGTVARVENGAQVELQYADALQNLMLSLDTQTKVVASFFYGPFGEVVQATGAADHRRQFNGKEHDQVSGLRYYGFRYYDPLVLRWNSADPLYRFMPDAGYLEPQRLNLYAFSLNNPVRFLDPDGRDARPGLNNPTSEVDPKFLDFRSPMDVYDAAKFVLDTNDALQKGYNGTHPDMSKVGKVMNPQSNAQYIGYMAGQRDRMFDALSGKKKASARRQQKSAADVVKAYRDIIVAIASTRMDLDAIQKQKSAIWHAAEPYRAKIKDGTMTAEDEKAFAELEAEFYELDKEQQRLDDELRRAEERLQDPGAR